MTEVVTEKPFADGGWQPRHIGRVAPRLEDDRLLAGRGRFVADIRLPGMVEATFVRSQIPHGRLLGIDAAAASAAPGVVAVVTAAELADVQPVPHFFALARRVDQFPLCRERVRYVGAPLAVVVAGDRYAAEDAAELVEPAFEQLPALASVADALSPDAVRLFPDWPDNKLLELAARNPAVDEAFATLRRVGGSYAVQRQAPVPLETRGVAASFEQDRLTVWSTTQFPHILRTMLSYVLDLPEGAIRVVAPDVGGGFGGKSQIYAEEYVVPWLARRLGRPVRWIEDRSEHMTASCHARDVRIDLEAAVRDDGTIEAIRGRIVQDVGSGEIYPAGFSPSLIAAGSLTGPYRIPHQQLDVTCVVTNKTPSGAYRGFGQPEAVFAMERLLDTIARDLRLDGIDLRRRLLIDSVDLPYVTASGARIDSGSHRELFERGVEFAAARVAEARRQLAGEPEVYAGAGLANYVKGVAANYFFTSGHWTAQDSCDIRFDPDGGATVAVGVSTTGQGLHTMVATVAADALGLPIERVRVVMGDTDLTPYGLGGWASRSTVVTCGAVHSAAAEIRRKATRIAAHLLNAPAQDVVIDDGRFHLSGSPDEEVTWRDVAQAALIRTFELPPDTVPGLDARATYFPPYVQTEPDESGRLNACPTYSNSTHVAVVAVDVGTGQVRVVDYGVFHDCGRVVNPVVVGGQLRGGVAQGIAGALHEAIEYDGEARPQSRTLLDYLVPTAVELPAIHLESLVSPAEAVPFGVKGVGETGIIGPPAAIVAAIEDALAEFSPAQITRTPVTPREIVAIASGASGR